MSSRIVFNEARHTYALEGAWVPGVTGITGKVGDKGGMVYKAAQLAARWAATNLDALPILGEREWIDAATKAHRRDWDAARDAGIAVHQLAEALVYGGDLPAETPEGLPWPEDVYAMAEQLARFYDAWDVEPIVHEAFVYHEQHRWAGRLDLIGRLSDAAVWLLDYKTGATGIYPSTALQLNAYANATHIQIDGDDRPMFPVEKLGAVWLRPSTWQLIPLRYDPELYRVFGHAARVADWDRQPAERSVFAPLPAPAKVAS